MNQLTVAFRTDASLDIGSGHVMRCLSLADALRERGAHCRFVCRAHPGNLLEMVRQRGYDVHALPIAENQATDVVSSDESLPPHAPWLGASWTADAQQTLNTLCGESVDWFIVDHYALDANWERILRPSTRRLMVIDDLADRPHDCDLLHDQNLGRTSRDYIDLVPTDCKILVGPKYSLLRPEFAALRPYSLARRANPELKHLLITMGGVDKDNVTSIVLETLKGCSLPADCHISVVMGPQAPWLDSVRDKAAEMPWETGVLINVSNMAQLMADSDLAIGAAGSTSWERCCLGLPSLIVVLADNQRSAAEHLDAQELAILLPFNESLVPTLCTCIEELAEDGSKLQTTGKNACEVTEGIGCALVIDSMHLLGI